jgi:hypothetical protein
MAMVGDDQALWSSFLSAKVDFSGLAYVKKPSLRSGSARIQCGRLVKSGKRVLHAMGPGAVGKTCLFETYSKCFPLDYIPSIFQETDQYITVGEMQSEIVLRDTCFGVDVSFGQAFKIISSCFFSLCSTREFGASDLWMFRRIYFASN